jgi:hypothetical protein
MKPLRGLVRLVGALLRELADESAYQRHLERSGRAHSAVEWQRFSQARLRSRYSQPKCC